jgi:hypothetical protein
MGLKSVDVKYVAATLFGDESGGFFGADFKGYSADDVMSYLEVCRRVFIAKYKPYIDVPASHAPSQKAASVSVAERNAYSEMTKFQLQIALLNNDVECAKYVLSRTELRELHENAAKLLH